MNIVVDIIVALLWIVLGLFALSGAYKKLPSTMQFAFETNIKLQKKWLNIIGVILLINGFMHILRINW